MCCKMHGGTLLSLSKEIIIVLATSNTHRYVNADSVESHNVTVVKNNTAKTMT